MCLYVYACVEMADNHCVCVIAQVYEIMLKTGKLCVNCTVSVF